MTTLEVIFLIVAVTAALAVVLQVIFGSWLGWTRWPVIRSGLPARVVLLRRTSTTRALAAHLSAITNLNLPLAGALRTAGKSERGHLGWALREMGRDLAAGGSVSEAMRRAHPACSALVVSVIAAGEQAGQLPRALADLERSLTDQLYEAGTSLEKSKRCWLYPMGLVLFACLMLAGMMTWIVPKYYEIFVDFDTKLPEVTLALIGVSRWLVGGPGLLLLLALFVLLFCLVVGGGIVLALRDPHTTMTRMIVDTWRWIPGLTRPVAFGEGMSAAIRVVAMSLAAGLTLDRAAGLAATLHPNRYLRRRWLDFSRFIGTGLSAAEAAEQAGLGKVFSWACRTLARGNANAEVVLRHAADYHRAIAHRWWRALTMVAWPLVTCVLGCMVGFVVLALFLPLVSLINSVAGGMP